MRFIYTKTFRTAFVIFIAIALFVISDATGYNGLVKDAFNKSYGSAAAWVDKRADGVKDFFATVFTIKNLAKENAQLSQQIDELAFENARLLSAKQENATLRRALNFKDQSAFNLVPVEVKTSDPTGFSQTVVINRGEDSGITVNDPVIVAPGLLVGKVSKVHAATSEVTLLTSPGSLVNAEVPDSGARGLIKGEHGLSLVFDLVTQNELIKSGDKIITSGLSDDFPRGLLIGEISGIRSSSSELFQKAFVTPAADLRNVKFLFVIL